jgi:DNA-binding transcriptional regulator PaaX
MTSSQTLLLQSIDRRLSKIERRMDVVKDEPKDIYIDKAKLHSILGKKGFSDRQLYKLRKDGVIRSKKIGGKIHYSLNDVNKLKG